MALLLTIIDACIAFGTLFISCELRYNIIIFLIFIAKIHCIVLYYFELSQRVENAYSDIANDADQLDWYLLPNELKQTLPMVIAMVQICIIDSKFNTYVLGLNLF